MQPEIKPKITICTEENVKGKSLRYSVLSSKQERQGLQKLVVLPDYSPSRGMLPVGTVAVYDRSQHQVSAEYLGPDIGCGMTLATFGRHIQDFEHLLYRIASREEGRIGGGNHFIDLFEVQEIQENALELKVNDTVTLVHSGSGLTGKETYEKGREKGRASLTQDKYLEGYDSAVNEAKDNRQTIIKVIAKSAAGILRTVFDRPHNTIELTPTHITYRKGAIKIRPGEYSIIPSSMVGEAVIVRATEAVSELENSLPHGTGRKISIAEAKEMDFDPLTIVDGSFCIPSGRYEFAFDKTRAPHCYRTIDEIMPYIEKYVQIVGRLKPIGHTV